MTTTTRPTRYVEQVMGMPISLALRGRHADDAEARGAWAEAVAALRDVDRVFSTYRPDSFVSRLGRGELTVEDCPVEVAEVLEYPSGNGVDRQIIAYALPRLVQETLDAQDADIDMVSGATVTSEGYLQSLQSALDQIAA